MTPMAKKKWYLAILVVTSRVEDNGPDEPVVALQYKLLRAADHEAAYKRAIRLGDREKITYTNAHGDIVTWECAGLYDLCEIDAPRLHDGVEVYSTMENSDPGAFVCPKYELTAFWTEANKYRTLAEMLAPHPSKRHQRAG